jgi:hypothetical protein
MTSTLEQALLYRARTWAGQLTTLANSFAPAHIRDAKAISSKVEEGNNGQIVIRITADRFANPVVGGKGESTLDARAQEYGSGLHGKSHQRYPIIGNPYLVFEWDKVQDWMHTTKDGKVVLHQVMHPGIEAANQGQGYIRPAIKELRKRAKTELSADVRQAILSDLRKAFGRKNG